MSAAPAVTALVLAAGASRRMGAAGPKQLLAVEGEPLVRRAARAAAASRCARVRVVLGAEAERVRAALGDLPVECVACDDWREGLAASLRAGVRAVSADPEADAVLIVLADQPAVTPAHLDALVARLEAGAEMAASAYAGGLGVPALFARSRFPDLLALRGDRGARSFLARHAERVAAVPLEAAARDVDTPEDAARLRRG